MNNTAFKIFIVVYIAFLLIVAFKILSTPTYTCKNFTSIEEATNHYDRSLDRDGDGIPCENLNRMK